MPTAAERAAARRARLQNREQDRIQTILGDRLAPGDDFAPSKPEPVAEENANANATGGIENLTKNMQNGQPPNMADLFSMMQGGAAAGGNKTQVTKTTSEKVFKFLDLFLPLLLVLVSNKILQIESLENIAQLPGFQLFSTIFAYQISIYFLNTKLNPQRQNVIFSTIQAALSMFITPLAMKLLIASIFSLINTGKFYVTFLVGHVIVQSCLGYFSPLENESFDDDEPVINLD